MPEDDGEGSELLTEEREVRMPERMAMPKVPAIVSNQARVSTWILPQLTASEDCQCHVPFCLLVCMAIEQRDMQTIYLRLIS